MPDILEPLRKHWLTSSLALCLSVFLSHHTRHSSRAQASPPSPLQLCSPKHLAHGRSHEMLPLWESSCLGQAAAPGPRRMLNKTPADGWERPPPHRCAEFTRGMKKIPQWERQGQKEGKKRWTEKVLWQERCESRRVHVLLTSAGRCLPPPAPERGAPRGLRGPLHTTCRWDRLCEV